MIAFETAPCPPQAEKPLSTIADMPCAYVLRSAKTEKNYSGSSKYDDPGNRLSAHNSGRNSSTKNGRPWEILHFEYFETYVEAYKREQFFKSGVGRKWIKNNFL